MTELTARLHAISCHFAQDNNVQWAGDCAAAGDRLSFLDAEITTLRGALAEIVSESKKLDCWGRPRTPYQLAEIATAALKAQRTALERK